jgi:hypothetical protein
MPQPCRSPTSRQSCKATRKRCHYSEACNLCCWRKRAGEIGTETRSWPATLLSCHSRSSKATVIISISLRAGHNRCGSTSSPLTIPLNGSILPSAIGPPAVGILDEHGWSAQSCASSKDGSIPYSRRDHRWAEGWATDSLKQAAGKKIWQLEVHDGAGRPTPGTAKILCKRRSTGKEAYPAGLQI